MPEEKMVFLLFNKFVQFQFSLCVFQHLIRDTVSPSGDNFE